MTSWADIQKLASDLQRVQLSQASKKLSEVNCIEVLQKLIASHQIDVVFTRDGHSYVTKSFLETEIKNECIAAGGRAALTDIAVALNIDFDHIEGAARNVVANYKEFTLSNSELFSTDYVHRLQSELRSLLDEYGSRTIAVLCKHWDLSPELLKSLLIERLSETEFKGVIDGDTIYTSEYLDARTMILRAVLIALTKATPISVIQKHVGLTSNQFWIAFGKLQELNEVSGSLVGSRTSPACTFRPKLYDQLVKSCVMNQYRQSECLQISTLKTLGVDSKTSLEAVLGVGEVKSLINLNSIYMKRELMDHCIQVIKEDMKKDGVVEIRSSLQLVNIPLDTLDEKAIGERIADTEENYNFAEGFVFKSSVLSDTLKAIDQKLEERAETEVAKMEMDKSKKEGPKPLVKMPDEIDDWDNKKGGKGGKKTGKGAKTANKSCPTTSTSNNPASTVAQVKDEELCSWIRESGTVPEELTFIVVDKLKQEVASILRKKIQQIQDLQLTTNAASSKKSLSLIGEKCRLLYSSFNTFESAVTSFADPLGKDLRHYLLKTVGFDLALAILSYATGTDNSLQMIKDKHREEMIESLPEMVRDPIRVLFSSVKSSDDDAFEKFHNAVQTCSLPSVTSLNLKKSDKNERSDVCKKVVADLREQLIASSDPAVALLLSVLYILAQAGRPTTASGKHVSQLISQINGLCSDNVFTLLQSCQKSVVTCIKNKDDEIAKEILQEDIAKLKTLIL